MSGDGYAPRFTVSSCTIASISSVVMPTRRARATVSSTSRAIRPDVRIAGVRWVGVGC